MKKNYKNKILGMSVAAAMLLSSNVYAGKIIGVDAGTPHTLTEPLPTQYGFGGWNLGNVDVRMVNAETGEATGLTFNESNGTYDIMTYGDSFRSDITETNGGTVMGILKGKDWPVGEPAGIKVVNDDAGTAQSGKSPNCIMTTSYLDEVDSGTGESGYLDIYDKNPDGIAVPTVCSSPFQSHKRFKINMQPASVFAFDEFTRYGKPIDLVFNLDTEDNSTAARRYQVFSKINNYTDMRLDGYMIELLDENGTKVTADNKIKFSLDISTKESDESGYEAVFAHGLWGPKDTKHEPPHFETDGFFSSVRAGFVQEGNDTQELIGGPDTLGSNYVDLFGIWLPSKWVPYGIFWDDDNDPTTDAELVAFWGTTPVEANDPNAVPAWHKGQADGWAEPSAEELLTWMADPLYSLGKIEDTLNLGPNYVVEVGQNSTIGKTFTIRITPRVAPDANQTAPSYIDANGDYIMPPTDYNGTVAKLVISPAPEFTIGADLSVGVADTNVTGASPDVNDTIVVVITADSGDEENLTLTETDVNSSIFVGSIGTDANSVTADGTVNVVNGTVVTATYGALTATTTATDGTTVTPPPSDDLNPSSGGGGCTYNPNSKNFDMMFLVMMALGLLYPFRRRFIK
ncbi:choice-of-anchor F family protein [Sulfurovum sp. XTW-4]|uniref:Choice-of-anchor F family protein n=1 Tax=Sulfurovum xiamenensis TaxID=3019066 RepID=A0ABT7QQH0_9BACT|nr:choice-of-anchor F family protein [Sulfurovum xiamenensis]MDM5263291.1 choice-of-anchor F family protein [Sulfurovum xiamenensis]